MSLNKDVSKLQESEVAKKLCGNIVAGSGCGRFNCGDVQTDTCLIECKTVTKDQTNFTIRKEWIDKMQEQAYEAGKELSALAFRFEPEGEDHFVVSEDTFILLLDAYKKAYLS